MRRCLALLPLFIALPAVADVAPVRPVPGGMVVPMESRDVTMLDEKVELFLGRDGYEVTVTYRFRNDGQAQIVEMGFPNREENPPELTVAAVKDFRAMAGDRRLPIIRRAGKTDTADARTVINFWECFSVPFAKGEVKTIVNTYRQRYDVDYRGTRRLVEYVLVTGAYWKGKIGRVEVVATPRGARIDEFADRTACDGQGRRVPYKLEAKPAGFKREGDAWRLVLTDLKPAENVSLAFPPAFLSARGERSKVEPGLEAWGPANLLDGREATAWAPRAWTAAAPGTTTITLHPAGKWQAWYRVAGIRVKNGTDKNLGRVKTLQVGYHGGAKLADAVRDQDKLVDGTLYAVADATGWQTLRFAEPVYARDLVLVIRETVKGSRSGDPCLAEVEVLLAE